MSLNDYTRLILSRTCIPYFSQGRPKAVLVSLDDLELLRNREKGQRRAAWVERKEENVRSSKIGYTIQSHEPNDRHRTDRKTARQEMLGEACDGYMDEQGRWIHRGRSRTKPPCIASSTRTHICCRWPVRCALWSWGLRCSWGTDTPTSWRSSLLERPTIIEAKLASNREARRRSYLRCSSMRRSCGE